MADPHKDAPTHPSTTRPVLASAPPAGPGWNAVLRHTLREMISDRIALVAAGCAFWATLALFPAISMLVSLYGLVFDPLTVIPQLEIIQPLLPAAAFDLIAARVTVLVSHPSDTLGVSLLISTLITLWSASTGTKSMLSALNLAYEATEQRSLLGFQAVGLAFTLGFILCAVIGIALLVFLPVAMSLVDFGAHQKTLIRLASLFLLLVFVLTGLSLLYRFGPAHRHMRWRWISPGSALATALWLVASVAFSYYVTNVAGYDATYGPLAAVAGIMMWFWVSAYAVLLGAELNAELGPPSAGP